MLAGGEATRFPGKLAHELDGEPMLARVVRRLHGAGSATYVAVRAAMPAGVSLPSDVRVVRDRGEIRGPLAALVSACAGLAEPLVFTCAGDMPNLNRAVVDRLVQALRPTDDAVVPVHESGGERIREPLAALYRRDVFTTAGAATLSSGRRSLLALLERIAVRDVPFLDDRDFLNVNAASDIDSVTGVT